MKHRFAPLATAAILLLGCDRPRDTVWHQETGYRWRDLDTPRRGRAGFTPLAPNETGVTHANVVDDEHALGNRNLIIGAGAAAADVDGDDRVDLFLASAEVPARCTA